MFCCDQYRTLLARYQHLCDFGIQLIRKQMHVHDVIGTKIFPDYKNITRVICLWIPAAYYFDSCIKVVFFFVIQTLVVS